jgi:hypothetical protein
MDEQKADTTAPLCVHFMNLCKEQTKTNQCLQAFKKVNSGTKIQTYRFLMG